MDFNAILSAALDTAIAQALQPALVRINELEAQVRIERGVGIALAERIDNLLFVGPAATPTMVALGTDGAPEPSPWFRSAVEAIVETAMEAHNSDYDHDEFQTSDQVEDVVQDKFSEGLESKLTDLLESASISISL